MNSTPDNIPSGYTAFTHHRRCALLQGFAPAESLDGGQAIRYWHPPENQGATRMQIHRPHDPARAQWMKEWDRARADFEAGKTDVEAIEGADA